ncbi:MAG: tRNA (adenosine(37)-N6)-threonylcarbamoyltransferase complex dimerization subunit type 1 TsaB [Chloroflexota bacterium]
MILCLETATTLCSVALCNADGVVASRESRDLKSHASLLTVFTMEVLDEAGIKPSGLEAVAVSKGPGSYTGLRIGVSAAKGISFGASVPLIGIETTRAMFIGMQEKTGSARDLLFCPVLDARRMEVYYAIYDSDGKTISEIKAEIINEESFSAIAGKKRLIIFGDGASKLKQVVKSDNVVFDEGFRMSAAHLAKPAFEALRKKEFEDVAYFEPLYLKDFIATISKKNILGM